MCLNDWVGLKDIITFSLIILGWYVVDSRAKHRDIINKKREIYSKFLYDAFHKFSEISSTLQKFGKQKNDLEETIQNDINNKLESSIRDIQLLGTEKQIKLAQDFLTNAGTNSKGTCINDFLKEMQQDIHKEFRKSLNLSELEIMPWFYLKDIKKSF